MKRITVGLDEDHQEVIDDLQEDVEDVDSQSAAIRHCIERVDDLEERVDDLEADLERVRRERRQIIDEREEKKELARYVEDDRRRRREREQANIIQRAKWTLFGKSPED